MPCCCPAGLTLDVYYTTGGVSAAATGAYPLGLSTNPAVPTMIVPLDGARLNGSGLM
jgi:hypothetical protein